MHEVEHHIVRTAVALCGLASSCADGRIRDDMRDETVGLLQLWLSVASRVSGDDHYQALRRWSRRMATELQALSGDGSEAALVAHTAITRLQLVLGDDPKVISVISPATPSRSPARSVSTRPISGPGPTKVLEYIREQSPARVRDIIQKFSGSLSDRTVKRSLQVLVASGHIVRADDDGVVTYRIIS
jgi:hypothetical protein